MRRLRLVLILGGLVLLLSAAGVLAWTAPALSAPRQAGTVGNVATKFSASRDGFAFINHAAGDRKTLVGKLVRGLCGGMSYAAVDYYTARSLPATSGIDRFLIVRNAQSIAANAGTFAVWTLSPDTPAPGTALAIAPSTRSAELPRLFARLGQGPVPIGLVKARDLRHIGENHQVVAYAMQRRGNVVRVHIYDPNHPQADDAWLTIDMSKPTAVVETCGGSVVDRWRGLFVERYSATRPPDSPSMRTR